MKQSLWLDDITRTLLDSGELRRYVDAGSITGVTSNPSTFDKAIAGSDAYDTAIASLSRAQLSDEDLFTELALEDLRRAADLLRPVFDATDGIDGWVSMELAPTLADDSAASIDAASRLFEQAGCRNLFVKIPGTPAGLAAIEESIYRGVPVNVTLLFSREQYLAAADAHLRGLKRRVLAGRSPRVASVASLFVSRWDQAANASLAPPLRHQLGIAVAGRTYRAHRDWLSSARWRALAVAGAQPQKLLWASTGTKSPEVPETLYAAALSAPDTIATLPEKTLRSFLEQGPPRTPMAEDGLTAEATLARIGESGIDVDALAQRLQREGVEAFLKSWRHLMQCIASKRTAIAKG
jgi:transaldolase